MTIGLEPRIAPGSAPDSESSPVIQVQGLVKQYGAGDKAFTAVRGIDFNVYAGEMFGFLGPNGAGKTTTISVLCTLLHPTDGQVLVNGYDVSRHAHEVRQSIGLIFQDPTLDVQLTAQENLDFHAFAYDVPRAEARQRGEQLLQLLDLWDRRHDQVRTFSGGMKRRLEIARGLLHRPSVLFLDEPTQGLDPQTRSLIWRYLMSLREADGTTLFMTTHYMDEAEYCDRIAIIDHGTIVALGTPDQLKDRVGGDVITLRTDDDPQAARDIRERWGIEVQAGEEELRFEVEDGDQFVPEVVRHIGPRVAAISVHRPTLDDVFMKLTGHLIREQEGGAIDRMRQFNRAWSAGGQGPRR